MSFSSSKKIAIILAAGKGERFDSKLPKQFFELKNKPIIIHSIDKFVKAFPNITIVIASNPNFLEKTKSIIEKFFPTRKIHITTGGSTRTISVWNSLNYIKKFLNPNNEDLISIHDSARPLISEEIITNTFKIAGEKGNAVCCVPLKFAIRKKIDKENTISVDRSEFYEVQTPQIFKWKIIYPAYEKFHKESFYDDASLVEQNGNKIFISEGSYKNIKITTPEDLKIAEVIM